MNLAHVLRKKRHYREAEQHYLTALSFAPGEADTLAALAFTCLLQVCRFSVAAGSAQRLRIPHRAEPVKRSHETCQDYDRYMLPAAAYCRRMPSLLPGMHEAACLSLPCKHARTLPERSSSRCRRTMTTCLTRVCARGRVQGGKDNVARSIEYYHKALSLRPEDTLSTEMLTLALQVCPLFLKRVMQSDQPFIPTPSACVSLQEFVTGGSQRSCDLDEACVVDVRRCPFSAIARCQQVLPRAG